MTAAGIHAQPNLQHRGSEWRRWTGATLVAATGTLGVLALVIWMNEFSSAPEKPEEARTVALDLSPTPKPKPKPKPRKVRKQVQQRNLKPIPTPDLGAALSGIDFGLPDVGLEGLGMDDRLLGDTQVDSMTQDSVDTPPEAVVTGNFRYPPDAKKKGIQGYVLLSILVDKSGSVEEARVLESSPPGVFNDSALEGIRHWRFKPAQYQGKPVKTWVQQKIVFQFG
ncbi:MAG: energy transducer TonB [Methylohalobius sp. ZOD2]|nr:energy transducer TonB [Methylothermaceae bacterium]